jgi:D-alanine transaminase
MSIIAYCHGHFAPLSETSISPMDRGFLFGEGIYEVIPVYNGHLFCLKEHLLRLNSGLAAIHLEAPYSDEEWEEILTTLILKNGAGDQCLYVQITRGSDVVRDPLFTTPLKPTIFAMSYPKPKPTKNTLTPGLKVTTVSDLRWKNCQVKATSRLAYVLMYNEAKALGFDEGIIMNTGYALEGTSSNFFMVRHGVLYTPPKSNQILSGITRDYVLELAEKHKIPYRENKISERELFKADEIWITSSIRGIVPVLELNGHPIGNGIPGALWERMWDLYAADITNIPVPVSS